MQRGRHLVIPLTLLGVGFMIFPPVDVILTAIPFRLSEAGWRFGAEGLLSNSMLFFALGMLMLMGAAALQEGGLRAKVMSWVSATVCVGLVALILAIALDAIQVRGKVPAQNLSTFDRAALLAIFRNVGALVISISVFVAARRMSKENSHRRPRPSSPVISAPSQGSRTRSGPSVASEAP